MSVRSRPWCKPIKYAEAGIRFLWRVERDGRRPVVYTYELDLSIRAYVPTGRGRVDRAGRRHERARRGQRLLRARVGGHGAGAAP
jgi:hypothetical protein